MPRLNQTLHSYFVAKVSISNKIAALLRMKKALRTKALLPMVTISKQKKGKKRQQYFEIRVISANFAGNIRNTQKRQRGVVSMFCVCRLGMNNKKQRNLSCLRKTYMWLVANGLSN